MAATEANLAKIAGILGDRNWVIYPNFISDDLGQAVLAAIQDLRQMDALKQAQVGSGRAAQLAPEVRSDLIHWLDEKALPLAVSPVWEALEQLRQVFNRQLYLGLSDFEAHLTVYPPAGRYAKHLDNFSGSARRVVSFILYLNPSWNPFHGGELLLYRPDGNQVEASIEPKLGTLACFLSADVPHEVAATSQFRYSLTGWFRR